MQLFRAIEESCQDLIYALEAYQDRLCGLAHEENSLGRFLKECGKVDKTRAGKMMTASGKTVCFCAQQRVQLRNPLVRLYQEVETFQYRAVADTLMTIDKMEKSRTAYRGALLWMKDASQQLDPDTYKQLDKFRKVQSHVRRTKARFDKLKLDTQQKIDLLSASRCNMYSYALVGYQNALLQFWEKTSKTMNAVAESFKGYQHYEFNILNELTETSKQLAKETAPDDDLKKIFGEEEDDEDKDKLLFFESEYHDNELKKQIENKSKKANPTKKSKTKHGKKDDSKANQQKDDTLLDLESSSQEAFAKKLTDYSKGNLKDLLTASDLEADDLTVLNDILNAPTTPVIDSSQIANGANTAAQIDSFMPSQLIDLDQVFSNLQLNPIQKVNEDKPKTAKKVIKILFDLKVLI